MLDRDRILAFIRTKGPVIPIQLATEFKQDTIITGAILSSLVKSNHLQLSHVKVGGSPLYYLKEHEPRLQDFYRYLNEKDKRSYDLLKSQKVLRDAEQTPLVRVSLRNIPDYAKSFERAGELYWRWYLLSQAEAEKVLVESEKPLTPEPVETKPAPQEMKTPPIKPVPVEKPAEKPTDSILPSTKPEPTPVQTELAAEPSGDQFHEKIKKYFNENSIIIVRADTIKRNLELDYVIEVPSAVGPITFYCKAKNKKRCNEGDLAAAYVKGQTKKLPVLFITTGEFTKKAHGMLSSDFHQMKLKNLR
jgi:hypothetical protein